MKKIAVILTIVYLIVIILGGCANNMHEEGRLIRIHVRANSNTALDQNVKMLVKDEIVSFLSQRLMDETDYDRAIRTVKNSLSELDGIAEKALKKSGFNYGASVSLKNEYFPTRAYEGVVVESGFYDALIVNLGSGAGDNWWCVIYPPLCFVGREEYGEGFRYKSKILELWRKYFPSSD